jgi:hypothetical protein
VTNPFTALGLPVRPDLTDEQVHAAWRLVAAATHPDRADGGDPARYAAASGAYAALRTGWGRSETYADLISPAPPPARTLRRAPGARLLRSLALTPARVRHGRPLRLAARGLVAVLLGVVAGHSGAGEPAVAGLVTGLGVWLILTLRDDLAPPPGR